MRELTTPASENYDQRFGGTRRLYGNSEVDILRAAHVCVIGIGGVGSWAVEALARTGVGELTLIDMDDVCDEHQPSDSRNVGHGRQEQNRSDGRAC